MFSGKIDSAGKIFTRPPAATKGWLAIAKLKPLSLFISLLVMLTKPFDNVKIEK